MLEEEYVQEAADKEWMQQYEKPNRELDNRCAIFIRYLPISTVKSCELKFIYFGRNG
jgi:hypothetical protein